MATEYLFILSLIVITVIGISLIKSISNSTYLSLENNELRKENIKLNELVTKTKKDKEDIISIEIGDRAIFPKFELEWTDDKIKFEVTYEVEILEVSIDQVKVKGIDYTTDDKKASDPNYKKGVLSHVENKWIPKSKINLIVDNSMRRDAKLQEILG